MLVITAAYLSLIATPYVCPSPMIISDAAMGPLRLGENVSTLPDRFNTRSEVFENEGDGGVSYTVAICGDVDIVAETEGKKPLIDVLITTSSHLKTDLGAHVGMTVAELQKLYPKGRFYLSFVEGSHANFITGQGAVFSLDQTNIPRRCFEYGANCQKLLQNTKAIEVSISKY